MWNIKTKAAEISGFLSAGMWHIEEDGRTRIQKFWIRALRIVSLTVRKFIADNCTLRASALTFYSLLSVVPMVALIFGIAKGFGLEQRLEYQLYQRLPGQEAVVEKIIVFSRSLLEKTKGGVVAGIGVAILIWSAIKLLVHIEISLNEIWKVKPRSYIRRFTDYLSIMFICPLLVIVSSSTTVYITAHVTAITGESAALKLASPLIVSLLKLLPFCLIWLLFVMIYMVMPNTRVRLVPGIVAGVVAGTLFQVFQAIYFSAQVMVAKYNAIYGSFAALPLFLIWLQLSWMIVLFGAQLSCAYQNTDHRLPDVEFRRYNLLSQKSYGLAILKYLITRFEKGEPSPSAEQIADALSLPVGLVIQLLKRLIKCMLVSEVSANPDDDPTFQPARAIHTITVSGFLSAWERLGQSPALAAHNSELTKIMDTLASIEDAIEQSPANRLIKDL